MESRRTGWSTWPSSLLPLPYSGHLWFLQHLFLISLLGLPVLLSLKSEKGQRFIGRLAGWSSGRSGIFLFMMPLLLARVGLQGVFGVQQSWADLCWYAIFFLVGYMMAADSQFTAGVTRAAWVGLGLWILGFGGVGASVLGILFVKQPKDAAFYLNMELLHGIGRSIHIGALCLFFFGTALLILTAAIRSRHQWLYAGAAVIGAMGAIRILTALAFSTGMMTESIVVAIAMTCWLCVCAFLMDGKKKPTPIGICVIACALMAAGVYIFTRPIPFDDTALSRPRKQLTFEQLHEPSTPHLLHMSHLAKPEWGRKRLMVFPAHSALLRHEW